ncbi:MAG: hypothetical protein WKF30_13995 [Pyrinomonadaceae bacterium]
MSLTERDPAFTNLQTAGEESIESAADPTNEELSVLSWLERLAFRVAHRMNRGRWKTLWTACQSTVGAGWIKLATYNILRVYGLEHVEATAHDRPVLLVANHRSF